MSKTQKLRMAIDIGGTFTDTVLVDSDNQILSTTKTATTHQDPTEGAMAGIYHVMENAGVSTTDLSLVIHGTTLATNALIERRGATVSTITTAGFRDILEIGYERRYSQYEINLEKPDLLVPRSRSFTIEERMDVSGKVHLPLDEASIPRLLEELETAGTQAVAICLLHSYANPKHEERLAELLKRANPNLTVSVSNRVSPEAKEFDRLCTTVANAYVQPLMKSYLDRFRDRLGSENIHCPVLMMTASGGMTTLETAAAYPIRLVESGPAGGAILAAQIARLSDVREVVSFDMGGTTAKLCLIDGFEPQSTRRFEIARAERFIKGSGMPVRIPVLEMIEIGAGGGSIASVDRLGRLQVGPQSAGSDPGPAAFGKGGTGATVTDADFCLGYLDPLGFAEGRIRLDAEANRNAINRDVARPLGLTPEPAAIGISEIVDENMASAARMHSVESGKELGERTMIAFGGNGPLHATRVARRAGINTILVPPNPGVGSAVGFLYAPISFEIVRSHYMTLMAFDSAALNKLLLQMEDEAMAVVSAASREVGLERRRIAFMRYHGQGHELEISLPDRLIVEEDAELLRTEFEIEYSRQFTRSVPNMTIEILNWGLSLSTPRPFRSAAPRPSSCEPILPEAQASIICDLTGEKVSAGVFERASLAADNRIKGPALIREPQSTTLVSADFSAIIDPVGNIILQREARP